MGLLQSPPHRAVAGPRIVKIKIKIKINIYIVREVAKLKQCKNFTNSLHNSGWGVGWGLGIAPCGCGWRGEGGGGDG